MKKIVLYTALAGCLVILILAFRPVSMKKEHSSSISGIVKSIETGESHDIVFRLAGNNTFYYINRGVESGLSIQDLSDKLLNQEVTLSYSDRWSPLPHGGSRHITQLIKGEVILYSEFN